VAKRSSWKFLPIDPPLSARQSGSTGKVRGSRGKGARRASWLAAKWEGPRTPEEAAHHRQAFDSLPVLLDDDSQYLGYVDTLDFLGDGLERETRRRALLRFARKLEDASMLRPQVYDVAEREALIKAAALFLVETERAFKPAAMTKTSSQS
jgi:hypothetical protein